MLINFKFNIIFKSNKIYLLKIRDKKIIDDIFDKFYQ